MKKVAATAWTLLIVALCTIPGDNLPDVEIFSADKLGHFVLFALFGWLWMWASSRSFRRILPAVLVAGLVFAAATEVYQGMLPFGREPSAADAVANVAGLLVGVWVYGHFERSPAHSTGPASRQ